MATRRQSASDFGVQGYVNVLVDCTKTTCIPADVSDDTLTFLVLSSEPIFSDKEKVRLLLGPLDRPVRQYVWED